MARRYYIEWNDTDGALYTVDISSDLYVGAELEINGYAIISRNANDDIYQAIQSTILDLTLIATLAVPLEDIYEEDDRYWSVVLYRDAVEQFRGSIESQEVEQSFTEDTWEIHVECLDAIGMLEDLSFVDTGGLHWTGSDTIIETIAKALKRGFRDQTEAINILANTGLTLTDNSVFQENAYIEMSSFLDENSDPNSCKEVVEQLLESMGCVMFQYLGDWVIINIEIWTQLVTLIVSYREYDEDGAFTGTGSWTPNFANKRIGSNINGSVLFHVGKNQSFITRKYIQSVRLHQKYEYRDQIIPNGEMIAAGAGPFTMPDWTLTVDATAFVNGVLVDGKVSGGTIALTSTPIKVALGATIKVVLHNEYVDDPLTQILQFKIEVGASDYYYVKGSASNQGFWRLAATPQKYILSDTIDGLEEGVFEHTIEIPNFPVAGDFTIAYYPPEFGGAHTALSKVSVTGVLVEALGSLAEGIEATTERTDNTFGSIPDVKEIRFATVDTSIVKNTFFDSSGDFIEQIKFDGGIAMTSMQILSLSKLGLWEERFSVFKGDVKGDATHEITNISPNSIDTLGSNYLLTRFSRDLRNDVTSIELVEMKLFGAGVVKVYSERIIYKESIKPKIV